MVNSLKVTAFILVEQQDKSYLVKNCDKMTTNLLRHDK